MNERSDKIAEAINRKNEQKDTFADGTDSKNERPYSKSRDNRLIINPQNND